MTQQELSDITGIQPSNLARFEKRRQGTDTDCIGEICEMLWEKHIEIKICDN